MPAAHSGTSSRLGMMGLFWNAAHAWQERSARHDSVASPRLEGVMAAYVVMFPADSEVDWAVKTEADRQATFDVDYEFGQLLEACGGAVTGGAGLTHSSEARTIRRGTDPGITQGPAEESSCQLSGFFIVTCDKYDDLVNAAQILTRAHPVVEIRPVMEF